MSDEELEDKNRKKVKNLLYIFALSLISFPFIYVGSFIDFGGNILAYCGLSILSVAMLLSILTGD